MAVLEKRHAERRARPCAVSVWFYTLWLYNVYGEKTRMKSLLLIHLFLSHASFGI